MSLFLRCLLGYAAAVLTATLLGSIVQTQFNLAALTEMGLRIPLGTRLATTGHDLLGFTPLYSVIVAVAFAASLPVAEALRQRWRPGAHLFPALGAGLGLWVALWVANSFAPMPTLIAATRGNVGSLAMVLSAALGGVAYAWVTRALSTRRISPCDA